MTTEAGPRMWVVGDNEPTDCARLVDAYGWEWWPWAEGGWRSGMQAYHAEAVTWWWLSMYRGPLKEKTR